MRNHYETLQVACDASADVIKAAYRALSQRHHPDRNPGDAGAVELMQAINSAHRVLLDPRRRRAYDAWLATHRPSGAKPTRVAGSPNRMASASRTQAGPVPPEAVQPRPAHQQRERTASAVFHSWRAAYWTGALVLLGCLVVPVGMERRSRTPAPQATAGGASTPWEIRGLDTAAEQSNGRLSKQIQHGRPAPESSPIVEPPPSSPVVQPAVMPVASGINPGLPIVSDPNGRPWPPGPGYVEGLPQEPGEGAGVVAVDNRLNAWPAFVRLVSADRGGVAIRYVYVPAMATFRIEGIAPGRYALQFQNLVTGELADSGVFVIDQGERNDGLTHGKVDVVLNPAGSVFQMPSNPLQRGGF